MSQYSRGQTVLEFAGGSFLLVGTAVLALSGVARLWHRTFCASLGFELTTSQLFGKDQPRPQGWDERSNRIRFEQIQGPSIRGTLHCGPFREVVTLPCLGNSCFR